MNDITVRYQCDGCYLEADTLEELHKMKVNIWRGGHRGESLYMDVQHRLYCNECFEDRKLLSQYREIGR